MSSADSSQAASTAATESNAQSETPHLDLQAELERVQAEMRDANDRVLRVQAELENYRKRVRRELDEERKYAAVPLLRDLLPVVENMQRAIDAAEQNNSTASLLEGVRMVVQQLNCTFEQHACQRIPAVGEAFDPNRHEALAQEPSTVHPAGAVTRETRAGYQLHDRVIRPAQVFVSTGPPAT